MGTTFVVIVVVIILNLLHTVIITIVFVVSFHVKKEAVTPKTQKEKGRTDSFLSFSQTQKRWE